MTAGVAPPTVSTVPWIGICLLWILLGIVLGISQHVSRKMASDEDEEEDAGHGGADLNIEMEDRKVLPNIYDAKFGAAEEQQESHRSFDAPSNVEWVSAVHVPQPARHQQQQLQRLQSSSSAYPPSSAYPSSNGVGSVSTASDRTAYLQNDDYYQARQGGSQAYVSRGNTQLQYPQRGNMY